MTAEVFLKNLATKEAFTQVVSILTSTKDLRANYAFAMEPEPNEFVHYSSTTTVLVETVSALSGVDHALRCWL